MLDQETLNHLYWTLFAIFLVMMWFWQKMHSDLLEQELEELKNTTIEKMWTRELNALSIKYMKYRKDRESRLLGEVRKTKKMKAKNSKVTKK